MLGALRVKNRRRRHQGVSPKDWCPTIQYVGSPLHQTLPVGSDREPKTFRAGCDSTVIIFGCKREGDAKPRVKRSPAMTMNKKAEGRMLVGDAIIVCFGVELKYHKMQCKHEIKRTSCFCACRQQGKSGGRAFSGHSCQSCFVRSLLL